MQWLTAFGPIEMFGQHASDPEACGASLQDLVLSFGEQMPMHVMARPGQQLYAEFEVRENKRRR